MPRRLRKALFTTLMLLPAAVVSAAGLGFLRESPVGRFNSDDTKLMMSNATAVLDSPDIGKGREWSNPKTGNGGRAEVRRRFTGKEGAPCAQLLVENHAGPDMESRAQHVVCNYPGRGWLVSNETVPASP